VNTLEIRLFPDNITQIDRKAYILTDPGCSMDWRASRIKKLLSKTHTPCI